LTRKSHLENYPLCVGQNAKHNTLTHSLTVTLYIKYMMHTANIASRYILTIIKILMQHTMSALHPTTAWSMTTVYTWVIHYSKQTHSSNSKHQHNNEQIMIHYTF